MFDRVSSGKSLIILCLLIILGFLGNYFAIPLFFGADFLFGSVFVFLVVYFYGFSWGVISALIIHSYTYYLWGHYYGLANFTGEALFVGYFLKRGIRNLPGLDWVFWLFVGMPLVWIEHGILMNMDTISTLFIMLKQSINGVFNALLASLLICYLPLEAPFQRHKSSRYFSLQTSLFNLMIILVLFPALLLTLFQVKQEKADLETGALAELQSLSAGVQLHLLSWYQIHLQALQILAAMAGQSNMTPSDDLQHQVEILKNLFPDFSGTHIEDTGGHTIAFAPKVNEKGESTIGAEFSDRLWFQESRLKQQPVVSDVITGRVAAINSPLVAIVAPVMKGNTWLGCATGTLDLSRVRNIIQPYKSHNMIGNLTITDLQDRVIASTVPGRTPLQSWSWQKTGMSQALGNEIFLRSPDNKKLPSMTRWKQSDYIQEILLGPELPWKISLEAPVAPLQIRLYTVYVKNMAIMACLTTLGLLFSHVFSHRFSRPLARLAQVTADLPEKLSKAQEIDWPESSTEEFHSLISNFKTMALALNANFQRLAEQSNSLKQSVSLLNATLESTADGVLVVNRDGLIVSCNKKFIEMWQIDQEIVHSREDETFIRSVSKEVMRPEKFLGRIRDLYDHPENQSSDTIELLDGRVFECYSNPQYLEGNIIGRVWSFRDVTWRQKAEETIRISEERFRKIFEESPIGIAFLGKQREIILTNQCYRDFLGYSEPEIIERGPAGLLHPDDWAAAMELSIKLRENKIPLFHTEQRYIRKDGAVVWSDTRITVLRDQDGELIHTIGWVLDITNRKQAEQALRASEAEYKRLSDEYHVVLEAIPDSLSLLSPDFKVVWANSTAVSTMQMQKNYSPGGPCYTLWHSRTEPCEPCNIKPVLDSGKIGEFFVRHEGRTWEFRMIPMKDDNGNIINLIRLGRDITETENLEAQLRQSQKLEAIGTLAGGIAHDFNNILSPIIGYTEMVLDDMPESWKSRADLEQVLAGAHRAKELVKQILTFSRVGQEAEMTGMDVSIIVQEALKLLRASLPSTIEIRQNLENAVAVVDPTQIHQVLINLCMNAAYAMEDKGILNISLTKESLDKSDLKQLPAVFSALKPGWYLKISVSDTGHGMDKDTLDRIFEPYFTTKEIGKGTGLGLSVVHGIVKRHGGEISVRSQPGKGSLFAVYLPMAITEVDPAVIRQEDVLPHGTERILFVDDEEMLTEIGVRILERLGYHVTAKTDSLAALDLFQSRPEDFDLILTDFTMPNLTGIELADEILRIRPDIPIILCTGFSEKMTEAAVKQRQIKGPIMKPLERKTVADLIRAVLDASRAV
ncbi:MAG: PAS domain S-box protein [Desulfocapsaceae bacterium]|nr:PAS domain S-box protein [Desulfocapsaceae bacterium]